MKINKLNYEAYAIDYLEGTLSAEDRKAFDAFLKQNPSVKQELDDYLEGPIVEDVSGATFARKDAVKQKGRARKGIIFTGLLLLGIFALGLRIGMISQSTEVPQELVPVQKTQREIESYKIEEKAVVKPNYMAEQLESKKSPSVERPSVEAPEKQSIAVNNTVEVGIVKEANQIDQDRKKDVTDLAGTNDVARTWTPSLSESIPAVGNLAEKIIPAIEAVGSLSSGPVKNPLVSLRRETLVAEIEAPAIETDIVYEPVKHTTSKRSRWIKILTPQNYKNVKLENTIAVANLKPAVTEIEKVVVPELLITK